MYDAWPLAYQEQVEIKSSLSYQYFMRLVSFKIKKYRSIEDSGEIEIDENITTLVGINESGKTNVLRALKKINHVEDNQFEELSENPRWYNDEKYKEDEIFITAKFKLDEDELEKIKFMDPKNKLQEIEFSRRKNMELICHLDNPPITYNELQTKYLEQIGTIISNRNYGFDGGNGQKQRLLDAFNKIGNGITAEDNMRQTKFWNSIDNSINEFWLVTNEVQGDDPDKIEIESILSNMRLEIAEDTNGAIKEYLIKKIPQFVYFDNIRIIDSRIRLSTLVEKLNNNQLDEHGRTAKILLDLGGLDPHELLELEKDQGDVYKTQTNKDMLSLKCSTASEKISKELNNIWSSNEHTVDFVINGDDLQVWITNKHDGTRLRLEERSRGYQWYFSFYTIFSVESEQNHKNAIILLDEPGLFLHPKAQEDFLTKTLPRLAAKNQIIYTTHSPSMIDLSRPGSIHTVTLKKQKIKGEDKEVSHISKDTLDSDRDALLPLQSALCYTIAQSMFIGKKNLLVEGLSDFWLLDSLSKLMESEERVHLKNDFVFVPVGGGTKSILFATMYKSQGLDIAVLLDADTEGRNAQKQLVENKILKTNKILLLSELLGEKRKMSIEDIFPEDYYLSFVQSVYQKELESKNIKKIEMVFGESMIIKKIERFFEENGLGKFNKIKVNKEIMTELPKADITKIQKELIDRSETIFKKINKIFDD